MNNNFLTLLGYNFFLQILPQLNYNLVKITMVTFNPNTVNPQNFSIPRNLIYYITMNPASPKVYLKLVKCCKYFYAKNQILIVENPGRINNNNFWSATVNDAYGCIPDNCNHKLWLTFVFMVLAYKRPNLASSFLQKVVYCDISCFALNHQKITWKEFLLLTSSKNVKTCTLMYVVIKDDKNESVLFEKILEQLPSIESLEVYIKSDDSIITSDTAKNILKLPVFKNLAQFKVRNIPETFDIETFIQFMENYKDAKFAISFVYPVTRDAAKRLSNTRKEIYQTSQKRIQIEFYSN